MALNSRNLLADPAAQELKISEKCILGELETCFICPFHLLLFKSEMKTMLVRGIYTQIAIYFRIILPFMSIYLSKREKQNKKGNFPSFHSYEKIYSRCMKLASSGSLQPEGSALKIEKVYQTLGC